MADLKVVSLVGQLVGELADVSVAKWVALKVAGKADYWAAWKVVWMGVMKVVT
jgi:hypothetical protein